MERDILAQIKHPFIVDLKYGTLFIILIKFKFEGEMFLPATQSPEEEIIMYL